MNHLIKSVIRCLYFTDIDECLDGSHMCDQICINEPGSYKCECQSGYRMTDSSFAENACLGLFLNLSFMLLIQNKNSFK